MNKLIIGLITVIAVILTWKFFIFNTIGWPPLTGQIDSGIHGAPSNETSYLWGEACTVNMTYNRSVEAMRADFEWCMTLHEKLRQ